jgi:hypothetical protein
LKNSQHFAREPVDFVALVSFKLLHVVPSILEPCADRGQTY